MMNKKPPTKSTVTIEQLQHYLKFDPLTGKFFRKHQTAKNKIASDGSVHLVHSFATNRYSVYIFTGLSCEVLWLAWFFHYLEKPGDDEIIVPVDYDFTNSLPSNLKVIKKVDYKYFLQERDTDRVLPRGITRLGDHSYSAFVKCRSFKIQLGKFSSILDAQKQQQITLDEFERTGVVPVVGVKSRIRSP